MGLFSWTKKVQDAALNPRLLTIKQQLQRRQRAKDTAPNWNRLSYREQRLIDELLLKTANSNLNNITRTMSYLEFFCRHPEIHWAFLAHMVSRNAGWNMTDLKGELLTKLLSEEEQRHFFNFIERGNWLIFQDAYPQLLLYEESLKHQLNLFHLLPYFHVSCFMEVLWNDFLLSKDGVTLTTALIINEQSYIEKRVIQHSIYKETVIDSLEFKLQDLLGLNQLLFPYEPIKTADEFRTTPLLGETLHHFASLIQRISFGKRLYHLLFHDPQLLSRVIRWALKQTHTGSRKDFWPQLFNQVRETAPGLPYERRIKDCKIRPGSNRLHSPILRHAWKDQSHSPAELGDWYENWRIIYYLNPVNDKFGDVKDAYCRTLEKMEIAVMARELLIGTERNDRDG